jgi:hypothetical protein
LEIKAAMGAKSSNPVNFQVQIDPQLVTMEGRTTSPPLGAFKDPVSGIEVPLISSCAKSIAILGLKYRGQILENVPVTIRGIGLMESELVTFTNGWGEIEVSIYFDETMFDAYENDPYFQITLGNIVAKVPGPYLTDMQSCQ